MTTKQHVASRDIRLLGMFISISKSQLIARETGVHKDHNKLLNVLTDWCFKSNL